MAGPEPEITPEQRAAAEAALLDYMSGQEEEAELMRETLREVLAPLGFDVPYTLTEVEEATIDLMRLEELGRIATAMGGVAAAPGTPSLFVEDQIAAARATLLERATEMFGPAGGGPAFQAISEYVTSTVDRQELAAREEVLTRREYIDIPTPEEFLDEFNVALATHTQQLVETGELDRDTAQWIRDNPDILFDEYIAELGTRAAAGEQVFELTGLEGAGEPELLGERPGRQEQRVVATERGALTETLTEAQQTAQTMQGGVTEPSGVQRTTQEQQQLREKVGLGATFAETEEIYGRPKLGLTYALSPMDWLAERATGTEIGFGVEREQGRREAQRRGPTVITPRKVR